MDNRYSSAESAYRHIKPEHQEVHQAILNWERWGRTRFNPQRCKSLEGNYRPPPMWEPPVHANPPNIIQAGIVEDLIRNAPNNYGNHLRFWYVHRLKLELAGKKLKLGYFKLSPHLDKARDYIKNNLSRKMGKRINENL